MICLDFVLCENHYHLSLSLSKIGIVLTSEILMYWSLINVDLIPGSLRWTVPCWYKVLLLQFTGSQVCDSCWALYYVVFGGKNVRKEKKEKDWKSSILAAVWKSTPALNLPGSYKPYTRVLNWSLVTGRICSFLNALERMIKQWGDEQRAPAKETKESELSYGIPARHFIFLVTWR